MAGKEFSNGDLGLLHSGSPGSDCGTPRLSTCARVGVWASAEIETRNVTAACELILAWRRGGLQTIAG